MLGNWLDILLTDESGATAMKYAVIAILLAMTVYPG